MFSTTIRLTTPILLASLGGAWTLQTGILNISQEGCMLISAFFAALGSYLYSSWIVGILFGIASAIIFNLIFGVFCVNLRANIWVIGMTLNIFANGFTILLMKAIFGVKGSFRSPQMEGVPVVDISVLPSFLNNFSLIIWMTVFIALIMLYIDAKTVFGLHLKAAGENEEALASVGVDVALLRHITLIVNGVLVGLAGSYLSISYLKLFSKGMSADRGWIAVAAVIFGNGNLKWTIFAAFLFGFSQALGMELQAHGVQSHLTLMLPYLFVVAALIYRAFSNR